MTRPKPIAFDSANKTGYAYMAHGTWVHGVLDMSGKTLKKRHDQWQNVIRILTDAIDSGCTFAVIEDCYHAQGIKTLKSLVGTSTRLSVAAEFMDLEVKMIYPSEWQSACGATGKRENRKAKAMELARLLGAKNCTEDEADAVCLCDYAINNLGG